MKGNTMVKIFKVKNARLRKLNVKKSIYFNHVENKHCSVCANRIADRDFKIPEGIVCGHPSNQNGKDRFCHYCHTCEHWKRETKLR